MNKKYLVAFVVLLFLYSCGQDDSATNKNLNSDNAIIEKGDINISIDIASELAGDIEIVSAQGSTSGVSNPV